tara:strand:- start:939 stop:1814 length:876 start_codon:yes stop_codon:yes gene_type:complete
MLYKLRTAIKDLWEYTKNIEPYILELVQTISSHYDADSSTLDIDEAKIWLRDIDYMGNIVQKFTSNNDSIIAGSFGLSMFLRLRHMKTFKYNDVDVYTNEPSTMYSKLRIWGYTISKDTDDNYTNWNEEQVMVKQDLINNLLQKKKWKVYDWSTLLQNHPDMWKKKNTIASVYTAYPDKLCSSMICRVNLIDTIYPFHQKDCFAMNVLLNFDMKQCQIAVLDTKGTFYPKILCAPGSYECIQKRKIEFNSDADIFRNTKNQLRRITKYMKRGFGLETNPEFVHRLPVPEML